MIKIKNYSLKMLFTLTFYILLIGKTSAYQQEKIVMGAILLPPYFELSSDNNHVTGLIPDLLNAIFSPMNIDVEYKMLSLKRIKVALQNGDIDGFPLMITEAKSIDSLALSDVYWHAKDYVWSLNSKFKNGLEWHSYADLKEFKIGIVNGASYGPKANNFIAKNKDVFYQSDSSALNIKLLLGGRLDAIFSNEDIILEHNKNLISGKKLVRSDNILYANKYKIGFSLKSKFVSDINKINQQIQLLKLEHINKKNVEAVYD